ncbi:MAG: hypothetical protein K2L08_04935 [Erysipelotrichaceae bacterium]|nr:hypothetical protein [Erysipelotrichaceae bacterium]
MRKEAIERILQMYPLQYHKQYHAFVGMIEEYPIVISELKKGRTICIQYATTLCFSLEQVEKWKEEYLHIEDIERENQTLTIHFKRKCDYKEKVDTLLRILAYMQQYIREEEITSYCSYCKENHTVKSYVIYDQIVLLCEHCHKKLCIQLEAQEPLSSAYKSGWASIIAPILGALLGLFLWYLLYQLEFFAPIASFVLTFGVWKGYTLFAKKINKYGIGLVILLLFVAIFLAQGLCLTFSIYDLFKADAAFTFSNALQNIPKYLQVESIRMSFIKDICMGYLIAIFTSYTLFVLYQKEQKQKNAIECLE